MTGVSKTCMMVRRHLSAYLDQELAGPKREELVAHLNHCEACRLVEQELRELDLSIGRLEDIEPVMGFTARVMADISESKQNSFTSPSLVYALVFSFFLLVGILLAGLLMDPGTGPDYAEDDLSTVFAESRDLNLLNIQEQSFALLSNSSKPGITEHEHKK